MKGYAVPRSETLALIAVAAICVVGIIVLSALKVAIPGVLGDLAFVAVGGGAGAALPSHNHTTTTP